MRACMRAGLEGAHVGACHTEVGLGGARVGEYHAMVWETGQIGVGARGCGKAGTRKPVGQWACHTDQNEVVSAKNLKVHHYHPTILLKVGMAGVRASCGQMSVPRRSTRASGRANGRGRVGRCGRKWDVVSANRT